MSDKIRLSKVNSTLDDSYDIFICSVSFEDRCLSIPSKIKRKNYNKVIALENDNGSEHVKKNSVELKNMFGNKHTNILISFNDPLNIADQIMKEINATRSSKKLKVLIDITTFTHEVLLICLKLLHINKKVENITCVYTNATEYCSGVPVEKKWLSQGCGEVHSVLGYPGMLLPSLKTHIIILVGYEYTRAFEVISSMEPTSVSLIYGSSNNAMTEKDKNANSVFKTLVEDMAFEYADIESLEVPCNDPIQTSEALQVLYEEHSDKNIIVVPMNNKMSTLGVALSIFNSDNVQACYAPAILYNETNYSVKGDYCYIFKMK